MPRQQENLQRARQVDQDVHPTSSSSSARSTTRHPHQDTLLTLNMAPLRALRADVITLLHGNRADKIALLRARRAFIYAHCREKGAELYALTLWKKISWGITIISLVLYWIYVTPIIKDYSVQQRHCTSEWVLDTTAPYHTTNQLCAFADNSAKNCSSPATYKGLETYGYGTVKLDLQYYDPEIRDPSGVPWDRLYRYAPLELHYTQYVPGRANTISVSQLMQHNNGETIPNKAELSLSFSRDLALQMGNATNVFAQTVNGHYVLKARVPGWRCTCPDTTERSIFQVSVY